MIFIILMILEGLCTIPFIILKDKTGKRKIYSKTTTSIEAGFIIIASIVNWFCYGAYANGLYIEMYDQFGSQNQENIIGLLWSTLPPALVLSISHILYIIMINIRYKININKNKREKK